MAREVEGTALEMRRGVNPTVSSNLTPSASLRNFLGSNHKICDTIFVSMPQPSFKIEWDAHEYEHKERSSDWFWAVGIITVSVSVVSVILGNIIFGILILISAFALSLFANRPPSTLHVVVDEKGVARGKIRYPYSTLESFWIDTEHPHKKIIMRSEKTFMPLIIVPLGENVDVEELHENLSHFLTEEFHSLPFVEKILEYLGF